MLVPPSAWQKSPPSRQYRPWHHSGTFERPILKAVASEMDSSSRSKSFPRPDCPSPRPQPGTKELQKPQQGTISKEPVSFDGSWMMTSYDGDMDALLLDMGYDEILRSAA